MQNLQKLLDHLTRIKDTQRPFGNVGTLDALIVLTKEVRDLQLLVRGVDNAKKE